MSRRKQKSHGAKPASTPVPVSGGSEPRASTDEAKMAATTHAHDAKHEPAADPAHNGDGHGHGYDDHAHSHHPMHHVSPIWLLFAVWGALMFFTGVTVALSGVNMGEWDIAVAMAIASVKAILVCLFFMHLLYDRPFNGVVFAASLLFVAIFIGLTLLDSLQYRPEIDAWRELTGN